MLEQYNDWNHWLSHSYVNTFLNLHVTKHLLKEIKARKFRNYLSHKHFTGKYRCGQYNPLLHPLPFFGLLHSLMFP